MEALRRVLALVGKELLAILRDPKSRFVVVGPPIIQFFVFGYAATFDVHDVRTAVLDESRSPASRDLLARLAGSPSFRIVRALDASDEIDDVLDPQDARLVIHVGSDFERRLARGETAVVQVIADGRNSNVASVVLGYVEQIVGAWAAGRAAGDGAARAGGGVTLVDRTWFNENLRSRWTIVAPLGATIAMVVVTLLSSLSVAREREFGTFDQLLVAPFRPAEILIGKAVPGILFGLADGLLLAAGAVFWFGVPFRGSPAALVVTLALFVLAIVGVGLFISSLSKTMQQGLLGSFVYIMPSVILSGFTTPIENMPDWLQAATLCNPLRYAVTALRLIFLEGARLGDVGPQLWPLLVIASVTLPLAAWMFRRRTA